MDVGKHANIFRIPVREPNRILATSAGSRSVFGLARFVGLVYVAAVWKNKKVVIEPIGLQRCNIGLTRKRR
jgi:hypothetical protein